MLLSDVTDSLCCFQLIPSHRIFYCAACHGKSDGQRGVGVEAVHCVGRLHPNKARDSRIQQSLCMTSESLVKNDNPPFVFQHHGCSIPGFPAVAPHDTVTEFGHEKYPRL